MMNRSRPSALQLDPDVSRAIRHGQDRMRASAIQTHGSNAAAMTKPLGNEERDGDAGCAGLSDDGKRAGRGSYTGHREQIDDGCNKPLRVAPSAILFRRSLSSF